MNTNVGSRYTMLPMLQCCRSCSQAALRRATWMMRGMEGPLGVLDSTMMCTLHTFYLSVMGLGMQYVQEEIAEAQTQKQKALRTLRKRSVSYAWSNGGSVNIEGFPDGVPVIRTWTARALKAAFVPMMLGAVAAMPNVVVGPDRRDAIVALLDAGYCVASILGADCIPWNDVQPGGRFVKHIMRSAQCPTRAFQCLFLRYLMLPYVLPMFTCRAHARGASVSRLLKALKRVSVKEKKHTKTLRHLLLHLPERIRRFGPPSQVSGQLGERAHAWIKQMVRVSARGGVVEENVMSKMAQYEEIVLSGLATRAGRPDGGGDGGGDAEDSEDSDVD